jgi:hypothetical protein
MRHKDARRAEFGDFQTPRALAEAVCAKARQLHGIPRTAVEPTCGEGHFLVAAHAVFGAATRLVGVEVDPTYAARAEQTLANIGAAHRTIVNDDFFAVRWKTLLARVPRPVMVIGNPPWVTNAEVGALNGGNLPNKSNFQGYRGLDALTGKSNFDISEWMCIQILEALAGANAAFAVLVKAAVARKVLAHAWRKDIPLDGAALYRIDAKLHFGVSVQACLFTARTNAAGIKECRVYASLDADQPIQTLGIDDGQLIADIDARRRTAFLDVDAQGSQWRSGIKHDCAKVLELRDASGHLVNGYGERVTIEREHLFPLLKSSDIANGVLDKGRWLLVPQRKTGQDTHRLKSEAPRAWEYLCRHGERLDARKSSIYRARARFSIFGVGPYTFSPWKVAISGLYKRLAFRLIGPLDGKPVVFDDTVYFTPCADEDAARRVASLLDSELAREFYSSFIFWDAKRPITASVLARLSLARLATVQPRESPCS